VHLFVDLSLCVHARVSNPYKTNGENANPHIENTRRVSMCAKMPLLCLLAQSGLELGATQ
jgi:hypothetical protein